MAFFFTYVASDLSMIHLGLSQHGELDPKNRLRRAFWCLPSKPTSKKVDPLIRLPKRVAPKEKKQGIPWGRDSTV